MTNSPYFSWSIFTLFAALALVATVLVGNYLVTVFISPTDPSPLPVSSSVSPSLPAD